MAVVINHECNACGACVDLCPTGAIVEGEKYRVTDECTECLACVDSCPTEAIVQL
ncbi:MAG TPA: 4Fe-4S binding protein [Candidatus Deferrimicrobiaceae bacterium]|nr:4Fe-4S binding protein [Candidatus Deferrimicrobiaceae bacterium]